MILWTRPSCVNESEVVAAASTGPYNTANKKANVGDDHAADRGFEAAVRES